MIEKKYLFQIPGDSPPYSCFPVSPSKIHISHQGRIALWSLIEITLKKARNNRTGAKA